MKHVLIVDDDRFLGSSLSHTLKKEGYVTDLAPTLSKATQLLRKKTPMFVLVDLDLPDGSGLRLVKELQESSPQVKTIVISGTITEQLKHVCIAAGALDVLLKPCQRAELLAKLQIWQSYHFSLYERRAAVPQQYRLNPATKELVGDDLSIPLRPKEYDILACLMHHSNQVVSKQQIVSYVWGISDQPDPSTIEVYIRRLRDKLPNRQIIQTRRGFGYQFCNATSGPNVS